MLVKPGIQQAEQQLDGHAQYGPAVYRWLDDFIDIWLADTAVS